MEQRILVVDNHDSFVYNLVQVLRESCTREIDVVRGED
ncbi:MAG: anthranilate synthase component II, partial [Bacteroidetes bacterium]